MARIALAWELGGELGHAMACATLGCALERRGHECVHIFRELHQLRAIPELGHARVYQAPITPREGEGFGVPDSWSDILLGCGYHDAHDLAGLVAGWTQILSHVEPDLLVADYAPTALLAARALGIPRVNYSNGFAIPPRRVPIPAFRVDARVDEQALARREARVLANVNQVLAARGAAPLAALEEQFETDEDFLCTFPDLDHYGNRPRANYWGPRYTLDMGEEVRWPYGEGPRVLVYLRPGHAMLDPLIERLVAHRCRVAAYIPGLDEARRARLQGAQRRLASRPIKLAPLLGDCDLFINHGGNVAPAALLHGVPQLLLPAQYEQFITAVRVEQAGAGLNLAAAPSPAAVGQAFDGMMRELPRFKQATQAYRRRYPSFSPQEQERRIVARIEQILAQRATQ